MDESRLPSGEFTITGTTSDTEIDGQVLAALNRRATVLDEKIAARGEELRLLWLSQLHQLRETCEPGETEWLDENHLSREVPWHGGTRRWMPFEVTDGTSDAAIQLVVDGGVDRHCADARADRRHLLVTYADAWTAELRQLRDERRR